MTTRRTTATVIANGKGNGKAAADGSPETDAPAPTDDANPAPDGDASVGCTLVHLVREALSVKRILRSRALHVSAGTLRQLLRRSKAYPPPTPASLSH